MEQLASAVLKHGRVYIQSFSETTAGVWIGYGPVHICRLDELEQITLHIRGALKLSIRGVSHPSQDEWKEVERPMLEAVGAKSWSGLARGAKAVGLKCKDGIVTITPSASYQNGGSSDSDLRDQAITSPLESDDLGRLLVRAFELSS